MHATPRQLLCVCSWMQHLSMTWAVCTIISLEHMGFSVLKAGLNQALVGPGLADVACMATGLDALPDMTSVPGCGMLLQQNDHVTDYSR
jgi:hypothetical protein